ncbi:YSIRK-type signal peptide-containing protein [Ligilactobacillus salivarius]|uniref:mucin-binding protein n=1 Tax=Ligilactobacillus salivarius TaxID=1624 RepID=UPI0011C93F9D|nr:YSIRK-type signal peptide-containing protein [Ligilactobacillus salivarius]TXJ74994.1 YSIRK-type signal peptide-containing protein [Ligilactobacillus salivarius]
MLSKKNRILATNYKQRWAIRKLTVGVVSVLLGGTMLFISGTTVSADNFIPKNESVSKIEKEVLNNNITEEKSINTSSEVITKETKGTDTTIDKTTLNVSEIDQQNNVVSSEIVPEKVQEIPTMSDASVELDNNTPTSEVEKVQSQPTVFSYQPKESDSRKNEDGDNVVTYFVIVREVTIVKPNGDEEILPYESMDTLYYEIESENDDLPLINFKAIDVPPIPGAKSPVIPGISQTVNSFMEDGIIDTSYVKPPVQRISSPEVTDLLEEEKYDELYDSYESKYKEYEKKFAKGDIQLNEYYDGLLIKEKYRYILDDDPKPIEGKEEKTITRTINVHLPNGEVQTTRQPVTLERKYTSVAGSDEKKYGPWTVGRWESFTAPEQEGYTAIPGTVDEVEVTSESLDAVIDIYYRADEPAIVEESEEMTDDPTPETSTTSPTPKNITNAKGKTATPELKNMDTKSKVFQNKLPQTGNKVETIYSIIGLLLTSILGVWEIIRKR